MSFLVSCFLFLSFYSQAKIGIIFELSKLLHRKVACLVKRLLTRVHTGDPVCTRSFLCVIFYVLTIFKGRAMVVNKIVRTFAANLINRLTIYSIKNNEESII